MAAGEHVQVRGLEHLEGGPERPSWRIALEMRDRPGPAYKAGVFDGDVVWLQVRGGLLVARAEVEIAWRGEYSKVEEIRARSEGAPVADSFWAGRPRAGYAVVARVRGARWIDPVWAGPRSYGYEWIVLEDGAKRASWLDPKPPPRGGAGLRNQFLEARARGFA